MTSGMTSIGLMKQTIRLLAVPGGTEQEKVLTGEQGEECRLDCGLPLEKELVEPLAQGVELGQ